MNELIQSIRSNPQFRAAIIVPMSIMLIFSFFNLTAPPDPARQAASFRLGVVNLDKGQLFPPIKVSEKVMEGLLGGMPFTVSQHDNADVARAALEAGDLAAVLIFPENFTKAAMSDAPAEFELLNAQHLTIAETALGAQLPTMLQLGMSAGVATLRQAVAAGKLPSGELPVIAHVETLHKAQSGASLVAPFVMTSTTWLAAMVGAIMLFIALKDTPRGVPKAAVRTILPIVSLGLASFALAIVIAFTTGDWALMLPAWLTVWAVAVCIGWLITGLFSVLGLYALLVIIPAAFYQPAVGGVQAPVSAAPAWLGAIVDVLPFDQLGAIYRSVILARGVDLPIGLLLAVGGTGIVLIWLGSLLIGSERTE